MNFDGVKEITLLKVFLVKLFIGLRVKLIFFCWVRECLTNHKPAEKKNVELKALIMRFTIIALSRLLSEIHGKHTYSCGDAVDSANSNMFQRYH